MKNKRIICFLILLITIAIDLYTKFVFGKNNNHLINQGFIFGSLQELPQSLTLVTLSTIGGIIAFLYFIFLIVLSEKLFKFKLGLSFLVGGILGNVVDRAMHGGTTDFIPINLSTTSIVFNFADVVQWIGALFIIFEIITKEKYIWFPENQRGFGLINPKEQIKFSIKLSIISFSSIFVLGIFSLSFLTLTLKEFHAYQFSTILAYLYSFIAISVLFILLVFGAGLFLSQKTSGPLFAFEKFVEDLLSGQRRSLKLREGDNYRHFEEVAEKLLNEFNKLDKNQ